MFSFFGKKNKPNTNAVTNVQPARTETPATAASPASESSSSSRIILRKAQTGLDNQIIRLKKEKNVDLSNHKARVFVVIDRSGSMSPQFRNGSVQNILTRLLPLALRFDDNGELEVYVFNEGCNQMESMHMGNYENYVKQCIIRKGYGPSGGTMYAPVIRDTIKDYDDGSPYPAFGLFITDGDNFDHAETDREIIRSSKYRIFYQFVGTGPAKFPYLEQLDNISGRDVDNTAFIKVADFDNLTDDELFAKLLEQYPQWLRAMHID